MRVLSELRKQLDLIVIYSDLVGSTRSVKNLNPKQVRRFY